MRDYKWLALLALAAAFLAVTAEGGTFHSWENSLEGWSADPDSKNATAIPRSLANGIPVGAITDGNYALELSKPNSTWTAVVRAGSPLIRDSLLSNTTMDLDIFLPAGSYQPDGKIQFQIQGQDMNYTATQTFNAVDNSYHLSWDYADDPEFNLYANWSQLTMILPSGGVTDPVYVDNFRLSNRYNTLPDFTVQNGYKVYLDEQFDGDLNIWREPSDAYSGPDTIAAGDGSLVRAAAGERGWRTRFRQGDEFTGRSLLGNKEAEWYTDPWYKGTTGTPLGVNPFSLQNGKLHITADEISPTVLNGLPTTDAGISVHDKIDYTSGLLTTQNLIAVKYGHFEMRAQMPSGTGLWPAFWLLSAAPGWPPEIDILEAHGQRPEEVHFAAHLTQDDLNAGFTPTGGWVPTDVDVPGTTVDITADFHDYSLDWNEEEIIWYFDGVEIGRMDTPPSMMQEMYLLVNLAVGGPGSWPGPTDATTPIPAEMIIDYIRVSQLLADYDGDGLVDQDDYTTWRNSFGQNVVPGEGADGNQNGVIDAADYTLWLDGFGAGTGSSSSSPSSNSIPEPSTSFLLLIAGGLGLVRHVRNDGLLLLG